MTEVELNRQELRDRLAAGRNRNLSSLLANDAWAEARRVWIVGGGPSLKDFDWELLRGEVVIGVNRAFEKPHVGLVVSMDTRYQRWLDNGAYGDDATLRWQRFDGPKVWTLLPNTPLNRFGEAAYYVVPRESDHPLYPPSLDMLGSGSNSGWMAMQVAWALGAREIGLLGFDMKGIDGQQAWYHSGHPIATDASCYDRFTECFNTAAPFLKAAGVTVINYCIDSGLTCFPRCDGWTRDIVLRKKSERPLVVGYFTKDTGYEEEIKGMVASARAHGLEVYVEGVESQGSWTANTYYKAVFIDRMLEKFPRRPLLFLDADSRIRRYPALLDNFTADFGASVFEWDKLPGTRTDRELSCAVLYLRPKPAVKKLVKEWIRLNETNRQSAIQDQRNLQRIVEATPNLRWQQLPMTYCQIFDSMAAAGKPVIEQMQASRRLKQEVGV